MEVPKYNQTINTGVEHSSTTKHPSLICVKLCTVEQNKSCDNQKKNRKKTSQIIDLYKEINQFRFGHAVMCFKTWIIHINDVVSVRSLDSSMIKKLKGVLQSGQSSNCNTNDVTEKKYYI